MAGIRVPNLAWINSLDNAGTGVINLIRGNASDEVEIGANTTVSGTFDSGTITLTAGSEIVFNESVSNDAGLRSDSSGHLYLRTHATSSAIIFEAGNPEAEVVRIDENGFILVAGATIRFNESVTNDADLRSNSSGDLILRSHATGSTVDIEVGNPENVVASFEGATITLRSATTNRIVINATGIGVFGTTPAAQVTGWGTPTGAATRTTFATSTVTLEQLAERVMAIIVDQKGYGWFGA